MSAETKEHPQLPDPKEVAKTYAEVAQRASKLITDHVQRQVKKGVTPPTDDLGIAQAFMDMMAKMLANPYQLAQQQMNLVWDYFSLWQHSTLRFMAWPPRRSPRRPRATSASRTSSGKIISCSTSSSKAT